MTLRPLRSSSSVLPLTRPPLLLIVDLRYPLNWAEGKAEGRLPAINETGAKSILRHGLPRRKIPWSTPSVPESRLPVMSADQIPIPVPHINGLWDALVTRMTYGTWAGYDSAGYPPNSVADLAARMRPVFTDLARALSGIFGDQFHVSFHAERYDKWVLVRSSRTVGVLEVRKWGPGAMTNEKILGKFTTISWNCARSKESTRPTAFSPVGTSGDSAVWRTPLMMPGRTRCRRNPRLTASLHC